MIIHVFVCCVIVGIYPVLKRLRSCVLSILGQPSNASRRKRDQKDTRKGLGILGFRVEGFKKSRV